MEGKLLKETKAHTKLGAVQKVKAIMHPNFAFYVRPQPFKAVIKDERGREIFKLELSEAWAEAWKGAFGLA